MADKQLLVTAPLVVTKDKAGVDRYLYEGTPVPADIPAEQVKRLRELRMVADADAAATDGDAPAYPEGEPSKSWTVPQLTAYAADNQIDLAGATRKDDVWAKVSGTPENPEDGDKTPLAPPAE